VKPCITTFVASGVLALALFGEARAGPLEDGETAYQRGDYETAVRPWRPSGDEGNVDAQFNFGLLYSSGQGVPQDYAQTLIWFRKAADQGDARAQVYLAEVCRGTTRRPSRGSARLPIRGTSRGPTLARCTVTAKECRKTLFALICGST
jgi:hypothetical protein